jgi:hypothetical protein
MSSANQFRRKCRTASPQAQLCSTTTIKCVQAESGDDAGHPSRPGRDAGRCTSSLVRSVRRMHRDATRMEPPSRVSQSPTTEWGLHPAINGTAAVRAARSSPSTAPPRALHRKNRPGSLAKSRPPWHLTRGSRQCVLSSGQNGNAACEERQKSPQGLSERPCTEPVDRPALGTVSRRRRCQPSPRSQLSRFRSLLNEESLPAVIGSEGRTPGMAVNLRVRGKKRPELSQGKQSSEFLNMTPTPGWQPMH